MEPEPTDALGATLPARARPRVAPDAGWREDVARLLRVAWPFLVTVPLLLGIALGGFGVLSAGRAFVEGESLWSKAQKNAAQSLARYLLSCDASHLHDFDRAIATPQAYRAARLELLSPAPDLARARAGFLRGGSHPDDVDAMIRLFRYTHDLPLMRDAIRLWSEADIELLALDAEAHRLEREGTAGCRDERGHRAAVEALHRVNERLNPMQVAFSDTLGQANRLIGTLLLATMVLLGAGLSAVGVALALRASRQAGRAERALALNENRLRLALGGSSQGLVDLSLEAGEVYLSKGLRSLFGLNARPGPLRFADLLARVPADARRAIVARFAAHARRDAPFEEEVPLHTAAGECRIFLIAGRALTCADGRPARLVASVQDITERRRLQDELMNELTHRRAVLRIMRETLGSASSHGAGADEDIDALALAVADLVARQQVLNERLGAILALSPDGFVSFDASGIVSHVSPAFAPLTGLAAPAIVGLDEAAFERRMNALCASDAPMPTLESLRRRGSGETVAVELLGSDHRVLGVELRVGTSPSVRSMLCLRDITREREVERLKTEFLTAAAHELRTPMASIHGFVELLRRRPPPPERRDEMLAIVNRQTEVMIGLIDDLLDLNRLQSRRQQVLAVEPLDLAELLQSVVAATPVPPACRPAVVHGAPAPVRVAGHRAKLARALWQLLSNAYKFSPAGGEVLLRIVHDPADAPIARARRVGVQVIDHGIGMSPEQLQRVGERFWRADASGHLPGSGLGVSIVREIVQRHGGALEIESAPGRGTCVTLWLAHGEAMSTRHEPVEASA